MKSNINILSFLTINDLKNYKVYKIKNLINGKEYVGFTMYTIEKRFNEHYVADSVVGDAIRKHGRENFTIEILVENLSQEEAGELEKHYIKELNTLAKNGKGYNIHEGGLGGNTLIGMSEEKKREHGRKISESNKGKPSPNKGKSSPNKGKSRKPLSEEHKQKISESKARKPAHNKGKQLSEEHKQKLRKPKSEEHKRKLSEINSGKPLSEEHKQKLRKPKSEETKRKISQATKLNQLH